MMPMSKTAPFILVDGYNYLFRAYHALPPLTNSQGQPTGAVVGMVNMLRRLLDEYAPEHLAVVFDAPGPSFRDALYPAYKAQRPSMPDMLRVQIEPLRQIVVALGLPLLQVPGVEADDVIGALALRAAALGMDTLIASGDKDLAQLVSDRVHLIDTMNNRRLDPQGVRDKFGVSPEQIVDYLTLVGDTADNIPGVPKCGPKTAAKWLEEFGSLDGLMARADEIPGKLGESLRACREQLPRSRELVTLRTDLDLELGPEDLHRAPPDRAILRDCYSRLEAQRLLASLEAGNPAAVPAAMAPNSAAPIQYDLVLDEASLETWLERLRQAPLFAFDTESTGLDYMRAELVGLSFAVEPHAAAYVPLAHAYPGAPPQLDRAWVLARLKPLLENPKHPKVGQNLKFDTSLLARYQIELHGIAYDTMLESYVLDPTATRHDMDSLAAKYLDYRTIKFEEVAGKGAKQISFDQVALEQAGPYAAEDADVTLRLHQCLWPRLEQTPELVSLFRNIEIPLVPVLSRMERAGVRIDSALLAQQGQDLARRLHDLEQQAHASAGQPFNLGSPKQIGEILFEQLRLPVRERTPTGVPSTAETVLEQLAEEGYALPRLILDHRTLAKLKSTYVDKLPQMVNPATGRVHTSYHQAVAATGRLSSSDPNLQNIPIRSEEGRRIRQAFIAEPGYRLLAADYSQIELRLMAHLSGDEGLRRAFAAGQDIHRATAAEVFATPPEAVSAEQRRSAKAINFGLIYGMSAFGLARQLGIHRSAAQDYVQLYFQRYPKVKAFMEQTREQARQQGYVATLFGRRLYLPEINARNQQRRLGAERTAINAPLQGTAADIIKRAMIVVDAWLQREQPPVRMLMQVHDELVFEVREEALGQAQDRIRDHMSQAAQLAVPLVVDIGVGDNWETAH